MTETKNVRETNLPKHRRLNTDPVWNIENQQLQTEAELNSRLKQQISKQTYADSSVQARIKDKISELKQNAVKLAQKLEGEKRKNMELAAIIRHMEFIREEDKKIQTEHRDDINFENVENLLRKIKKLEYDLEQMFSKLNELNSKCHEKKSQVDAFRTERVIDSCIFVKIEKEIVLQEIEYKKLLIEKLKFDKEYQSKLQKYLKMKTEIQKQSTGLIKKDVEDQSQEQQFFAEAPEIHSSMKFTQIHQLNRSKSKFRTVTVTNHHSHSVSDQRMQRIHQIEFAVKKIFQQTGLNSANTFIQYLNDIDTINEELFQKINRDNDRICELKKELVEAKTKKTEKTLKYFDNEPVPTKAEMKLKQKQLLEQCITNIQNEQKQTQLSLQKFTQSKTAQNLEKTIQASFPEELQIDNLQQFFASIEQKMNKITTNFTVLYAPKIKCKKDETVEELIAKIKKIQESDKIMGHDDFKKEYQLVKGDIGKRGSRRATVKKSC